MRIEGDKAWSFIAHNVRLALKSSSGFHLPVAGLLGVAGLVLALLRDRNLGTLTGLPWLAKKDSRLEKLLFVPGLQNLGNNCFLNVILQALASTTSFQPFLQKVMEECESSTDVSWKDDSGTLQLTFALGDLLEELSASCGKRVVLSPRRVMHAMSHYVRDFNLTSQQDAEEAFLLLLSSLREEFTDCYPENHSSLADALSSSNSRILAAKVEIQNEQERWQQHFLGPFDGILSSVLTCKSCSSEISMNFQFFHSLPLLPVLESGATIMPGCTLEDCLRQFIAAEQLEDYNCSHCWHIAALKYLHLKEAEEVEIEKLRICRHDSCTCPSLPSLKSLPWSNDLSHTIRQLSVARCPKILCIHLQRASVNQFGELIKLQGHVGFPLILNLLPFMLKEQQCNKAGFLPNHFNLKFNPRIHDCMYAQNTSSNALAADLSVCIKNVPSFVGESDLYQSKNHSKAVHTDVSFIANNQVNATSEQGLSKPYMYRLASVVEHFGRAGGGHYSVYRSVRADSHDEHLDRNVNPPPVQWFCISDSEVHVVTEDDVLDAEASLLFYERILES